MRINFTVFCLLVILQISFSQAPKKASSGEIYKAIEKLNFLGTALYVAAHPDDENTRMISYLSNHVNAETYYLSLTRGDGGQNQIGPEIRELLGVLRTQELMEARKVDGGKQLFSRANDFGFSKNAEETIRIWDSEKVKQDVVWAIRKVKPDVIINRFDHRTSGTTHGHHTASAMLSYDLFEKAADKSVYPEQLKYVAPWQANRLYFNTTWWFFGSEEAFEKADKSKMAIFDVGTYFPVLGISNTEIAAISRSKHICQGMGNTGTRGEQKEYLELLKGNIGPNKDDIFSGINTTWTRIPEGLAIQKITTQVLKDFNFAQPQLSLPSLFKARTLILGIKDQYWRERKLVEINTIIEHSMGLFVEAVAKENAATPNDSVFVNLEVIARNIPGITVKALEVIEAKAVKNDSKILRVNERYNASLAFKVPNEKALSAPYWLMQPGTEGVYRVDEQTLIGLPETPRPYHVRFTLGYGKEEFSITKPLIHKFTDSEMGEVYQPFEIIPEASLNIKEKVVVFANNDAKDINVEVKAFEPNTVGELSLSLPEGWTSVPQKQAVNLKIKGETKTYTFKVLPPNEQSSVSIGAKLVTANGTYDKQVVSIDYKHVPLQRVIMPIQSKLVKIDIKKKGDKIAYLMGTGDEIPSSLRQIGYTVDEINLNDITSSKLKNYDALVMGIRAYNKHDDLKFKQSIIFDYVKEGGNFIVQYNTNGRDLLLKSSEIMPYSLEISRERVTVEDAPITILKPDHIALTSPNIITQKDFEGWTQERGLYFPNKWDERFTPLLSCSDPGENAMKGGLLVGQYGKGNVVYTGYSWFRQLPEGVEGAYRIFANLISLPKLEGSNSEKP